MWTETTPLSSPLSSDSSDYCFVWGRCQAAPQGQVLSHRAPEKIHRETVITQVSLGIFWKLLETLG